MCQAAEHSQRAKSLLVSSLTARKRNAGSIVTATTGRQSPRRWRNGRWRACHQPRGGQGFCADNRLAWSSNPQCDRPECCGRGKHWRLNMRLLGIFLSTTAHARHRRREIDLPDRMVHSAQEMPLQAASAGTVSKNRRSSQRAKIADTAPSMMRKAAGFCYRKLARW